ncbi:hypothetical protein [Chromohalobacter israelensis]|uniref:hypothetical protein n=1 Tax=Chromohalobacter israelensis TaxID=141390 RepID=UPI001CC33EDD|nr:hypothetical protein [Chromohalobacter salexigens]MBZ5875516.1 hypothetical protein [Chromohalobacter salexigens]
MPPYDTQLNLTDLQLSTLKRMLDTQISLSGSNLEIIEWASPIPYFGDPSKAEIATVGLNPSNREFVSTEGFELTGSERRFQTLDSLEISSWELAKKDHLYKIYTSCTEYFFNNPYDGWFKALDKILGSTSFSFYSSLFHACHLDLIPYATEKKWAYLSTSQKAELLKVSKSFLGETVKNSPIEILILNGKTVVDTFSKMTDISLRAYRKEEWTLPRNSGSGVSGVAYEGELSTISGIPMGRKIKVLGYNHNIQSSFGVTTEVRSHIQAWINKSAEAVS